MSAKNQKAYEFDNMVKSFDMSLLMKQDIVLFGIVQNRGKINSRAKNTHYKGSNNIRRNINVILKQRGLLQLLFQTQK